MIAYLIQKQGSKNFKQSLIERNDLINFYVKEFVKTEQPDVVMIEDLKNVKHKSPGKIHKKTMNKMQRWSYDKTFVKLGELSENEGFEILKVNPSYKSNLFKVWQYS